MDLIISIIILVFIIMFIKEKIDDAEQKKIQAAEKVEKEKEAKLRYEAEQERIEKMRNTEFFKDVSKCLYELVKKDICLQIEKYGKASPPYTIRVETTEICFNTYTNFGKYSIKFNSLGYKNLTEAEKSDLIKALSINGFNYCADSDAMCAHITSDYTYWQPIIDNISVEHNSKFKDIF